MPLRALILANDAAVEETPAPAATPTRKARSRFDISTFHLRGFLRSVRFPPCTTSQFLILLHRQNWKFRCVPGTPLGIWLPSEGRRGSQSFWAPRHSRGDGS